MNNYSKYFKLIVYYSTNSRLAILFQYIVSYSNLLYHISFFRGNNRAERIFQVALRRQQAQEENEQRQLQNLMINVNMAREHMAGQAANKLSTAMRTAALGSQPGTNTMQPNPLG